MSNGFSRRDFLKGAAASAFGIAAVGITGCGSQSTNNPEDSAEKIVKPDLSSAKYDADIVIVGSGAAGMAAAVEAGQKGMKAILLEANGYLGGTTNFAEGICGFNTRLQKRLGLSYDFTEVLSDNINATKGRCDSRIIYDYIRSTAENMDWLENMGVKFLDIVGNVAKTQHFYDGKGAAMIQTIAPYAQKTGVKFLMSTSGKELYMESGKVVGIMAEDKEGLFAIRTKAVVLACGGFIQNTEMVKDLTRLDISRLKVTASPGHMGEGIKMAYAAGADDTGRPILQLIWAGMDGIDFESQVGVAACNEPVLWVDTNGERFTNEGMLAVSPSNICNAMLQVGGVYSILNQDEIDRLTVEPCSVGWGSYVLAGTVMSNLKNELQERLAKKPDNIFMANTVAELAKQLGMDPQMLQATIDRNNKQYKAGVDDEFSKDPKFLRNLENGPYYAFRLKPNIFSIQGGIIVSRRHEVMSKEYHPIPGLYCAGQECQGMFSETYSWWLAGTSQGYGIYSGRNSVQNAYQYIRS